MKFLLPLIFLTLIITPLTPIYLNESSYLYPVYAEDSTGSGDSTSTAKDKLKDRARELELKRETTIKRLDDKKASVAARFEDKKEKLASRAAEFIAKLAKFRDRKKAERVEKINENLGKINKNRTAAMLRHLERMQTILDKLQERVRNASPKPDMSKVNEALKDSSEAIDEAKKVVVNQTGKDYTIIVNTESTVKTDSQTARNSLREDLKEVHDLVVEARKALTEAIRTVVTTLGGSNATK